MHRFYRKKEILVNVNSSHICNAGEGPAIAGALNALCGHPYMLTSNQSTLNKRPLNSPLVNSKPIRVTPGAPFRTIQRSITEKESLIGNIENLLRAKGIKELSEYSGKSS
jgi:hypothetical protein